MSKWDCDNLSAPHTQRELAQIVDASAAMCGRQNALIDTLRAELAKEKAGRAAAVAAAYEAAAAWCADQADKCADAARWGGHPKYIADCKAASFALRNAWATIRAMVHP